MIAGTVYMFQHTGGEQVPVSMIQINEYILNSRGGEAGLLQQL